MFNFLAYKDRQSPSANRVWNKKTSLLHDRQSRDVDLTNAWSKNTQTKNHMWLTKSLLQWGCVFSFCSDPRADLFIERHLSMLPALLCHTCRQSSLSLPFCGLWCCWTLPFVWTHYTLWCWGSGWCATLSSGSCLVRSLTFPIGMWLGRG